MPSCLPRKLNPRFSARDERTDGRISAAAQSGLLGEDGLMNDGVCFYSNSFHLAPEQPPHCAECASSSSELGNGDPHRHLFLCPFLWPSACEPK